MRRDAHPDATIAVALAGAGEHAHQKLIPALRQVPAFELRALASRDPDKATQLRRFYPALQVFPSHDAEGFLESADLVVVAGPPAFNFPVIQAALAAGKHIFCEKPMAVTRGQFETLTALAARRPDCISAVGLNLKYSATLDQLLSSLPDDPIVAIHVDYASPKPTTPSWGASSMAVTATLWHTIHVLDLLASVTGEGRLANVRQLPVALPNTYITGEICGTKALGTFAVHSCAPTFSLTVRVITSSGAITTLSDLRRLTRSSARSDDPRIGLFRPQPQASVISSLAEHIDCAGFRTMFDELATAIQSGSQPRNSFANAAFAHSLLFDLIDQLQDRPSTGVQ